MSGRAVDPRARGLRARAFLYRLERALAELETVRPDRQRALHETQVLATRRLIEETRDELVELWHAGGGGELPLHAFLGMTEEEYAAWVRGRAS